MLIRQDMRKHLFWICLAVLLGASLFYGISTEKMRRSEGGKEGKVESGALVTLVRVIDGDSLTVVQAGQKPAALRILGIKALDASIKKDAAAPYGQAAIEAIQRLAANRPLRVLLNTPPKDKNGRYLATLYVDDQDLGLRLIKEGLALAYTVYPFPAMSLYLKEQELARAGRRGLWANAQVTARSLALIREWRGQSSL